MGVAAGLLLVIFFWFFLLRRSYKKLRKGQPRRSRFKPDYDLSDPCPKRRGETAFCGYCPLLDLNTGECARGRWRS